jgi:hypothetical protein
MLKKIPILSIAIILIISTISAGQSNSSPAPFYSSDEPDLAYDTWEIFTSHRTIQKIEWIDDFTAVVLTTGGFYFINPGQEVTSYTRADGKYDIEAVSFIVDRDNFRIWFGYADGTISYFDYESYQFRHFDDIRRNDRFVSNRINDMILDEGILYLATDFGLVLFNTDQFFVIDTYTRLGRLGSATPVQSISKSQTLITLGTNFGVAQGSTSNDLKIADNWTIFDDENGFVNQSVSEVMSYGNQIYATSQDQNYFYDGNTWSPDNLISSPIRIIRQKTSTEWDIITDRAIYRLIPGNRAVTLLVQPPFGAVFTDIISNSGFSLLGTNGIGLGIVAANASSNEIEYYAPNGPATNLFEKLVVSDSGELILGTSTTPGRFDIGVSNTGFSILDVDGTWHNFDRSNNPFLAENNLNSFFNVASSGKDYFIGSWGSGIIRLDRSTNEFEYYNDDNAGLEGISVDPNFYVSTGLAADRSDENLIWAISWSNNINPLGRFNRSANEWEVYPMAAQSGIGTLYHEIFVDTYGQKWITLMTNSMAGRGLMVVGDPAGGSGESFKLISNQDAGGLPNEKVNAIIQDKRGEVWVGTDRGIGRFLFPDRIINGSAVERRAQPLINEDTTAFDRVLLRDVRVTSMVVDGNNQKWIGSNGDGIYLIEESGRRVIRQFNTSNSPLPSNSIKSLALNTETGELYIATENSLVRYKALEREGVSSMEELRVFPNPYSYRNNPRDRIVIENLSDDATVHILTVDGRLVRRFQTRGGRVDWDGRDDYGEKLSTGVYFIVATGNNSDKTGRGKVLIVF